MGSRRLLIQHSNNVWQTPHTITNYENFLAGSIIRTGSVLYFTLLFFCEMWNKREVAVQKVKFQSY
jgi:hypothetical protein